MYLWQCCFANTRFSIFINILRKPCIAFTVKIGEDCKYLSYDTFHRQSRGMGPNIAFCNYSRPILIVKGKITLLSKLAKNLKTSTHLKLIHIYLAYCMGLSVPFMSLFEVNLWQVHANWVKMYLVYFVGRFSPFHTRKSFALL